LPAHHTLIKSQAQRICHHNKPQQGSPGAVVAEGKYKERVAKMKGGRTWVFIRPRGGGESIPLMVSSNLILNPNIVNGTSKNSLFRRFSAKHLDGQLTSNLVFQILFASRGPVRRVPPPMCRCEQTIDKLHAIRQLDRLEFQSRTKAGHGEGGGDVLKRSRYPGNERSLPNVGNMLGSIRSGPPDHDGLAIRLQQYGYRNVWRSAQPRS
jgi:hypothetical protein